MPTNAEIARKIRDAIYERSNEEGGAISREQMDEAIEGVLVKMEFRHSASSVAFRRVTPAPGGGVTFWSDFGSITVE